MNEEKIVTCGNCEGVGHVHRFDLESGWYVKETCENCEGHGYLKEHQGILVLATFKHSNEMQLTEI